MLNLNIQNLEPANGQHNGIARIHLDHYIGQGAQTELSKLAASNKTVGEVILICESQTLIVVATRKTVDVDKLKKMATGFMSAVKEWFEELDQDTRDEFLFHPNPARDAAQAYAKGSGMR